MGDGVAVAMGAVPVPVVGALVAVGIGDVVAGGVGLAVAAVAALCAAALWDAAALAECVAPEVAAVLPAVVAEPEQPVSASPAVIPRPVISSAGPRVTKGVFEEDRISLLLDLVPVVGSAVVS